MNRKKSATLLILASLVFVSPSANAASSIGGKCKKIKSFTTIGSKIAICSKKGSSSVWTLANSSQKSVYQAEQKKQMVLERSKSVENLALTRDKYSNASSLVQSLNESLIESKKSLIENSRNQLIELQKQKSAEEKVKSDNQNNVTSYNNSISTIQANINSYQSQITSQLNTINYSKANSDSAYNAYMSAKAQSDYLSYSYQSAVSSNTSMLSAKVLCDFGFGSCGIYSSAQYNYNASIISQYNSASSRTSGAYASYSSYYNQYSSDLGTLNSLKSQQTQFSNNINTLNSQKTQANTNISNAQAKISTLEVQINQATAKFAPLENAKNRITQDVQKYSELKGVIDLKGADIVAAIDDFLKMADESFISTTSVNNWNGSYSTIMTLQKDIDLKISEINSLISTLESYLTTL